MSPAKQRKYSRTHKNNASSPNYTEEASINMSLGTALGILGLTLAGGMVGGYLLKKMMD